MKVVSHICSIQGILKNIEFKIIVIQNISFTKAQVIFADQSLRTVIHTWVWPLLDRVTAVKSHFPVSSGSVLETSMAH